MLGVDATPLPPILAGACGISRATSVNALEGGSVKLTGKATISCELAQALANWVREIVQPIAIESLRSRVAGIRVVGSYECRTRDHIEGARISEHAFGNAIDLSAFAVDGRWIEVGGMHRPSEQAFLDRIRAKACGPFKTVLGPGSDSYHADHLHLDVMKRRTAGPSRGLYCR
jgi:hypothetical protein